MAEPAVEWKLTGVEEVMHNLTLLKDDLQKKSVRSAARSAANVIRDNAKWRAKTRNDPSTPTDISENVYVQYAPKLSRREGGIAMRVGVLGGAKQYVQNKSNVRKGRVGKSYATGGSSANPGGDTFYWRFLEFGTRYMGAQSFMQPAMLESIEPAQTKFAEVLNKQIDKLAAKFKK